MLVVCAVSRWQRRSSFDVNARGVLNALTAAIACGEPHDSCWGSGLHSSKSASNESCGQAPLPQGQPGVPRARRAGRDAARADGSHRGLLLDAPTGGVPWRAWGRAAVVVAHHPQRQFEPQRPTAHRRLHGAHSSCSSEPANAQQLTSAGPLLLAQRWHHRRRLQMRTVVTDDTWEHWRLPSSSVARL